MKIKLLSTSTLLALLLVFANPSFGSDQLITLESKYSPKQTAERLVAFIKENGLTLFARIDHQANAAGVDLDLGATELILFGNPKAGSVLMQCAPTVAIDLPQKALIWQDAEGITRLAYLNPAYLKELHSIVGCDPVLAKITDLLSDMAKAASGAG